MSITAAELPTRPGELRSSEELEVYGPEDAGYDAGRASFNTAVEHRPALVAIPRSARGVIEVVDYARRTGASLAIQSTGHGPARAAREAILISMSGLTEVQVNPERRVARIGGGAKWQAVLDVATPHGLAPLLGSTPDVSAVGYTLGGGLGWLSRKYGIAADSVEAFEMVTAAGRLIRVTPERDPELFWGLRGAGAGHLGVVTAMEIRLYPISQLYAGNLYYPAEMAVEVMRRWRDWIPTVPEALTSAVTLLNFPPFHDVPPELRGASKILVRGAFDGPVEEGERLLAHWRKWSTPEIDAFGPLPFAAVAEISQDPLDPVPYEGTGLWMHGLSDATIDELVAAMFPPGGGSLLVQNELRHYGGAVARPGSRAAAFGNRDALILLELVGVTPDPGVVTEVRELIEAIRGRIAHDLTGGHYLNYVERDDRRHGVDRGTAPGSFERLAALKARLDPLDLFDHGLDVTTRQLSAGPPGGVG